MSAATLPTVEVRLADLECPKDQAAVLCLLKYYAQHPMGQGSCLAAEVADRLMAGLLAHPTSLIFLATADDEAVGLATCFIGFSTFQARQLINLHDLVVAEAHQQCGIGGKILDAICEHAIQAGYCAITLEVLASNPARQLYIKKKFQGLDDSSGPNNMLFGKRQLD